ncbi:MAG: 16S rRNA (guanine(966)-N(2))-methyltransferase RsmD [Hespellia sp.]|nr:16S rRNA (guanine(966)-N(2))-methyltransferase RsmD [Hespellia sp.]
MRVIAGSAKRLQLKSLEGLETRPTTDRIKETLFNILQPYLCDCEFLDLFSGSGGIGIEALSRGAKEAVFVEKNPRAMEYIKDNLTYTKLDRQAVVMGTDALSALHRMEGSKRFDIVFMDPPYQNELEKQVLEYLATSTLLNEEAIIIVEASLDTDFSYLGDLGYIIDKEKKYKTNKHLFIEKKKA